MRIGLIFHQFRTSAGGLERYLNGFATQLASAGHRLEMIGAEIDAEFSSLQDAEFHEVRCSGSKAARMRQFAERSAETAKELGADITLGFGRTFAHDLHRAGGGCHKHYSRMLPLHKRIRRKNQIELELEERLYTSGETGHFVVNSGLVGQQLQREYDVPEEKISVIHTPVDCIRFHPPEDRGAAKTAACETLDSPPGRPTLLFVSLNHRRKGLHALLDVWPKIDANLWIAGAKLRRSDQQKISKLGIGDRIFHLGPDADLPALYRAVDGFLHPTLYDACANTVLQSLASGTPGLISSRDGASELIDDGKNGFLLGDPTDTDQVLTGIRRLLSLTDEEWTNISQNARTTAIPLTWENHLSKWFRAIDRLKG